MPRPMVSFFPLNVGLMDMEIQKESMEKKTNIYWVLGILLDALIQHMIFDFN